MNDKKTLSSYPVYYRIFFSLTIMPLIIMMALLLIGISPILSIMCLFYHDKVTFKVSCEDKK